MLTINELIERMNPIALAETIASIDQVGNSDANELATIDAMRAVLTANVGEAEAAAMIAEAQGWHG